MLFISSVNNNAITEWLIEYEKNIDSYEGNGSKS